MLSANIPFLALFSGVPTKQLIVYSNNLSITALGGAGRGYDATGLTVAACNDFNKSSPHDKYDHSFTSDDERLSEVSVV